MLSPSSDLHPASLLAWRQGYRTSISPVFATSRSVRRCPFSLLAEGSVWSLEGRSLSTEGAVSTRPLWEISQLCYLPQYSAGRFRRHGKMRRDVTAGDGDFAFCAFLPADRHRKNCDGLFGGTALVFSSRPPELRTLLQAEDVSATIVSVIKEAS